MPTPVFISDNFCSTVPTFLPPPSEEAKVGQNCLSPSLGLKSLSLLVHWDSFQILKRVIGRALAGANQPSTVASQWPSARLRELEGWPSSPVIPYTSFHLALVSEKGFNLQREDAWKKKGRKNDSIQFCVWLSAFSYREALPERARIKQSSSKEQQLNRQAFVCLTICAESSILVLICSSPVSCIKKGKKKKEKAKKNSLFLPQV